MGADIGAIAGRLIAAYDSATTLAPITAGDPDFDVAAGYDVLREIESRRMAGGWTPVGRKIGFTNRTIWPRYGVYLPMWAHVWSHTVHYATANRATLALGAVRAAAHRARGRVQAEGAGAGRRRCARRARLRRVDRAGLRNRAKPFPGLEIRRRRLHGGLRPARRARRRRAARGDRSQPRRARRRASGFHADVAARRAR